MEKKKSNISDLNKENKKIFALITIIIITISVVYLITTYLGEGIKEKETVSDILKNKETAIVYIENSDSKKCKDCASIKKYLDSVDLNYILYDVKSEGDKEYKDMLRSLGIKISDFNYPAVIYIKEGSMYSNIINLQNTKVVKRFIEDFDLLKVNKN